MGRASAPTALYLTVGMDLHFLQRRLASSNSLQPLRVKELAHNRFMTR
jgi:hypothetical protein